MNGHAYDPAKAFLNPEGVLVCCCGWPERGLLAMKRHIANASISRPIQLPPALPWGPVYSTQSWQHARPAA